MKKNRLSWPEYFMTIAYVSSLRSADPNTKVGACVVDTENKIVGVGYNGYPRHCHNTTWNREGEYKHTKYAYVVHAEANAILNSSYTQCCTMYCTLFPCNECAKLIIQSGIIQIIYLEDKYHDNEKWFISRELLNDAGVIYKQYNKRTPQIDWS
jgi:dCMP deaminase